MKTRFVIIYALLILPFFAFTSISNKNKCAILPQETTTIEAVFDGHEDYGYNFIATDGDDFEYTITFQEINEELLNEFDLKSDTLIGTSFKITYKTRIEVIEDENGYEDENEINTIINLEKL
jgi:hypothetical protein